MGSRKPLTSDGDARDEASDAHAEITTTARRSVLQLWSDKMNHSHRPSVRRKQIPRFDGRRRGEPNHPLERASGNGGKAEEKKTVIRVSGGG